MKLFFDRDRIPYLVIILGLFIAGTLILIDHCRTVWLFTADDAYITFRYSANLVAGYGPTFNRAPPRAEGYTSLLWMLIMTIPHLLGFGLLTFAKIIGIFATLANWVWIMILLYKNAGNSFSIIQMMAVSVVCFFYAILPETAIHAVSGMETAVYTFLFTGLVTLACLGLKNEQWALDWLPLIGLLVGLTRPEANLSVGLVMGFILWKTANRRRFLTFAIVLYILPGLVYFLWRWQYYGILLPLPYYVKSGGGGFAGWSAVCDYIIFILAGFGLYQGLGILRSRTTGYLLFSVIILNLVFFLFISPIMNYDYRFLFPLTPAGLAVAGMGVAFLLESVAHLGPKSSPWIVPVFTVGLVCTMFAGQALPRARQIFDHKLAYALGMGKNHISIGHVLNAIPHDGNTPVLVVNDAGAMPYVSGWYTLDAGGLNNPVISQGRQNPIEYIYAHHPEVVVLMSTDLITFRNDSQYALDLYQGAVADGLEVVARSPFYQEDTIWVLARPEGEAARQLSLRFRGDLP